MNCGRSEMDAVLFPARTKGESTWVCVKCLPAAHPRLIRRNRAA